MVDIMQRKQRVASGNLLQAHTWKGMLEAKGIQVELRGEALLGGVGELPTDVQSVELWVDELDSENALIQLANLDVQTPDWQCLKCHEINDASFDLCWYCSAEKVKSIK